MDHFNDPHGPYIDHPDSNPGKWPFPDPGSPKSGKMTILGPHLGPLWTIWPHKDPIPRGQWSYLGQYPGKTPLGTPQGVQKWPFFRFLDPKRSKNGHFGTPQKVQMGSQGHVQYVRPMIIYDQVMDPKWPFWTNGQKCQKTRFLTFLDPFLRSGTCQEKGSQYVRPRIIYDQVRPCP